MPETIDIPFFLFIIAFWLGNALFFGTFLWLHDIKKALNNKKNSKENTNQPTIETSGLKTIKQELKGWCIRGIWLSLITSIYFNIQFPNTQPESTYWPEMLILTAVSILYCIKIYHSKNKNAPQASKTVFWEIFQHILMALSVMALWAASLICAYIIMHISIMISMSDIGKTLPLHPIRDAVLCLGFIWLSPYIWLYRCIRTCSENHEKNKTLPPPLSSALEKFSLQQILWPLLIGLLLFMLPIALQHFTNSEKLHKWLNPPQRLRVI